METVRSCTTESDVKIIDEHELISYCLVVFDDESIPRNSMMMNRSNWCRRVNLRGKLFYCTHIVYVKM